MDAILIDTNVLVYAYDVNDAARQDRSHQVLRQLGAMAVGRLSVQCLAEFFSVVTRKLKLPLTPAEALQQMELLSQAYPVLDLTLPVILEAARGVRDHQLSYYDAQLWALARLNQIPFVFTEDFTDGQMLEGIRFVNPFAPGFALGAWL